MLLRIDRLIFLTLAESRFRLAQLFLSFLFTPFSSPVLKPYLEDVDDGLPAYLDHRLMSVMLTRGVNRIIH